jgi:hypothetical protein
VFPEIEVSATGTPRGGPVPFGETRGLVDAHMHLMAYEFIGGSVHCGRPWHPYGVEKALVDCPDHMTGAAPLETGLGGKERHDPVGWPTFKDWPDNQSLTHETSYYKWLERAWMGGLRTYVNLFVDNEVLCEIYPLKRNSCNEMATVRLQAQRINELQDYIDAQNGGPARAGSASSRTRSRRAASSTRASSPSSWASRSPSSSTAAWSTTCPQCDRAQIDRQLDEVHKLGVRDMELVNKFDNALGGVAGDAGQTGVVTNTGNKYDTNQFLNMETCTGPPEASDKPQQTLAGEPGDGATSSSGASGPSCRRDSCRLLRRAALQHQGPLDLGEYLIGRMIEKGMIIDPDHLSVAARNEVLALVEKAGYSGIVSSHTWSSPDAIPRIYRAGGFVTPVRGQLDELRRDVEEVPRAAARPALLLGLRLRRGHERLRLAGRPRGKDVPNPVTYPFKSFDGSVTFDKQRSGQRVYDINVDGVDHYGLYPDWIEDLRKLAGDEIVEDMSRGSEGYLQMWERAEGIAATRCQPARTRATRDGIGRVRIGDTPEPCCAAQASRRPARRRSGPTARRDRATTARSGSCTRCSPPAAASSSWAPRRPSTRRWRWAAATGSRASCAAGRAASGAPCSCGPRARTAGTSTACAAGGPRSSR